MTQTLVIILCTLAPVALALGLKYLGAGTSNKHDISL